MQYRDAPLQQRVHCIVRMFDERTANEPAPLSRERIRQVIEQVVMELEEERRREVGSGLSLPDDVSAGGCNCS